MGAPNLTRASRAFDRTYEGLKHSRETLQSILEGSFDRTYEGLKPGRRHDVARANERPFDRTYEGLKPRAERGVNSRGRNF